jgi:hypothetical protein
MSRQFAGRSPDCDSARTASAPSRNEPKRTAADRRDVGRGRTRTQASVMTPRIPSLPTSIRSGDGPGARARQPPRLPDARRRDRPHRLDEVVDVRLDGREVPARPRRDPAAERGELEGLREVAQRQPCVAELPLQRGAERAGLDARAAADGVDLEHAVQAGEVERHGRAVDLRRDAADHARAAAVRDDRHALGRRPFEHGLDVVLVAGAHDGVGREAEVAAESRARRRCRSSPRRARRGRAG